VRRDARDLPRSIISSLKSARSRQLIPVGRTLRGVLNGDGMENPMAGVVESNPRLSGCQTASSRHVPAAILSRGDGMSCEHQWRTLSSGLPGLEWTSSVSDTSGLARGRLAAASPRGSCAPWPWRPCSLNPLGACNHACRRHDPLASPRGLSRRVTRLGTAPLNRTQATH
jgi:hypothetical protein